METLAALQALLPSSHADSSFSIRDTEKLAYDGASLAAEVVRLQRRLERERRTRKDTETIAEKALAELYAKQVELEGRQRELRLTQAITIASNEASTIDEVLDPVLLLICAHMGWPVGHAWTLSGPDSPAMLTSTKHWCLPDATQFAQFRTTSEEITFSLGDGLPGAVWASGKPRWIESLHADTNFPRSKLCPELGLCSGLAFPILVGQDVVMVMEFFSEKVYAPDTGLLDMLAHIGTQLGRIVERERAKEVVRWQAYHDSLTGLPNRSLFLDRCAQVFSLTRRGQETAAVLFLDLDRFKHVNDTLGHSIGDDLLCEVALRIQTCLRPEDTLARLGGDEFTILLPRIGGVENAARVADRVQEVLTQPIRLDAQDVFIGISIGVSMFPGDGEDVDTLLQHADAAMYRSKRQGGAGYFLFAAEMDQADHERLSLESHLRQAIARHELILHYQPQIDSASGRIIGVEALVRWQHPDRGTLSPAMFIPLAEETGLILPIGNWVLQEAVRQAAVWHRAGHRIRMAVNLSARQFGRGDLDQTIAVLLGDTGLPAGALELELTESVIMAHGGAAVDMLNALKQLGVRLAVDDFGTGYSSLAYLRRFPVDALKVDQSFVRGLGIDDVDTAIVRTIIQLAQAIGMEVIAEGVETQQQQRKLATLGCDTLQGYFFGRPCSSDEVERSFEVERLFKAKHLASDLVK